jgi:hypothetical protein
MSRLHGYTAAALMVCAVSVPQLRAEPHDATLAVVMTNDPDTNQIQVYDTSTRALVQTLSTHGKGGASGNARGVKQLNGDLFAAVNNGSNSVAVYRRNGRGLAFDRLVTTTSAPVSIDFANDHMYVAGVTTVDSFQIRGNQVTWLDGTTSLQLAGGATPPVGSTAQVGALTSKRLLVTLKADPDPGTVDLVALHDGAIAGSAPVPIAAPAASLTPFGFSVYRDGSAVITLAHSNQDGLFRDGAFTSVIAAGQNAPCWTTRYGKYVFTANAASGTVSRVVGTGEHVFVDSAIAATIATGGPADLDASNGVLGVIDHSDGQSHLTLFTINAFGELAALGTPVTLGVANANG